MPPIPLTGTLCVPKSHSSDDLWLCEPFSRGQAWLDLWFNANDRQRLVNIRGVGVTVKRGQLAWSLQTLGERWRWGREKVRSYLAQLQDERKLMVETTNLTTIITVIDYTIYNPDTAPELPLTPTPETTPDQTAEPMAEHTTDQTAEPTQKGGRGEGGRREEGKRGRESAPFAEIPSDEEVRTFCGAYTGDMARGIPGGIPDSWWMDWLAYQLTRPQFPPDWKRVIVLNFVSDWVKGIAKARTGLEKNAAALSSGQSQANGHPAGWCEGDAAFWWTDSRDKLEAALAGLLMGGSEISKKNAARLRVVISDRFSR